MAKIKRKNVCWLLSAEVGKNDTYTEWEFKGPKGKKAAMKKLKHISNYPCYYTNVELYQTWEEAEKAKEAVK